MMITYRFLLTSLVLVQLIGDIGNAEAQGTTQHTCFQNITDTMVKNAYGNLNVPHIAAGEVPVTFTYECHADGNIDIHLDSFKTSDFSIKGVEPAANIQPPHCQSFLCSIPASSNYINITKTGDTGCKSSDLVLLEFDLLEDNGVRGGQCSRKFALSCTSHMQTVAYTFTPIPVTAPVSHATDVYEQETVTMEISKSGDETAIQNAVVGEKLNMNITVASDKYYIKPIACSAGRTHAKIDYLLWDEISKSNDPNIFVNDWNIGSNPQTTLGGSIIGTFFAFHFLDTEEVFFQCEVRLCYQDDTTATGSAQCNKNYPSTTTTTITTVSPSPSSTPVRRRKRRSNIMETKTRTVSSMLRIYDTAEENRSIGQSVPSILLVVSSVSCTLLAVIRS